MSYAENNMRQLAFWRSKWNDRSGKERQEDGTLAQQQNKAGRTHHTLQHGSDPGAGDDLPARRQRRGRGTGRCAGTPQTQWRGLWRPRVGHPRSAPSGAGNRAACRGCRGRAGERCPRMEPTPKSATRCRRNAWPSLCPKMRGNASTGSRWTSATWSRPGRRLRVSCRPCTACRAGP